MALFEKGPGSETMTLRVGELAASLTLAFVAEKAEGLDTPILAAPLGDAVKAP